jgi:hypothetical protein
MGGSSGQAGADGAEVVAPGASRETPRLLGLVLVGLALRGVTCALSVDVPGDGPTRAITAYEWAQAPHVVIWGVWPPGLLYLSGFVSLVAPDPVWSVRLVNVLLGTAVIPVFFWLVRRVFGADAAWLATALLAVLPLHVELSATSLAEVSFVFEMVMGIWFVATVTAPVPWQLIAGLTALLWATMTRYEAWWFAPVLGVVAAATMRRWLPVLGVGLALVVFPLVWSVGNWLAVGDAFYGFTMARKGAEIAGTPPISLPNGIAMLAGAVIHEVGWPLALSMLAGGVLAGMTLPSQQRARVAYAAIAATFWLAMTWFAMRRGHSIFNRYLLLGIVLLLPYATLPWTRLRRHAPRAFAVGVVLLACSTITPRLHAWPPSASWITWSPPRDMQTLTAWMRHSSYRDAPILITEMGWAASYFALYWPEAAPRRLIVSSWTEDDEIRRFLAQRRPLLLVTTPEDEPMRARLERLAGYAIDTSAPLQRFGAIEVHAFE